MLAERVGLSGGRYADYFSWCELLLSKEHPERCVLLQDTLEVGG